MAIAKIDSTQFAEQLLDTYQTALGKNPHPSVDEDIQALKRFAECPEFSEARAAAQRLRNSTKNGNPFVNNIITSALEELGL